MQANETQVWSSDGLHPDCIVLGFTLLSREALCTGTLLF
jgi:hypothetical protein